MFGKKNKKSPALDPVSEAELNVGIRVMQDDLDELSGKSPKRRPESSGAVPHGASGTVSGSPFLSEDIPVPPAPKRLEEHVISDIDEAASDSSDGKGVGVGDASFLAGFFSGNTDPTVPKDGDDGIDPTMNPLAGTSGSSDISEVLPIAVHPGDAESGGNPESRSSVGQAPASLEKVIASGSSPVEEKGRERSSESVSDTPDLASMLASLGSRESARNRGERSSNPEPSDIPMRQKKVGSVPASEGGAGNDPHPGPSVGGSRFRILLPIAFLLLLMAGAGGYFLFPSFFSRDADITSESEVPDQSPLSVPEAPEIPEFGTDSPLFSSELPNILTLDTEGSDANPEGIVRLLADTEASVHDAGPSLPVEFVIRDVNNNPVAFSRFVLLAGLPIPSEILSAFDEDFSIYFVMDGSEIRRALSIDIREGTDMKTTLRRYETELPSWFDSLLYGPEISRSGTLAFQDGVYGTLMTRFANFDDGNLSFDYAVLDDALLIGTSKDSFRSALGNMIRIR